MSSVPIEEGAMDWETVRPMIVQMRSKMQMMINKDAQENAERDTERGLFIEQVNDFVKELHQISDKIEGEFKGLIASGELLQGVCERDGYLDQYTNIIGD